MLNKIKNRKQEGFTIIEVLIVLAIAGLIMLIVFLAVPALQRNSRNNETKNEANRLATGMNEFISNANGTMPASTDATAIKAGAGTKNIVTFTIQDTDVATAADTAKGVAIGVAPGTCTGNVAKAAAGTRTVALQYGLEGGQSACITI